MTTAKQIMYTIKLCTLFLIFVSCKKVREGQLFDTNVLTQKATLWIDKKISKYENTRDKNNVGLLQKNLDFKNAKVEERDENFDLLVIPVFDEFLTKKALDVNSTLNLILVMGKDQEIRFGYIVYYLPEDGKKIPLLSSRIFSDIFKQNPISIEGKFRFLDITGGILSQLHYKDGKYSYGQLKNGNDKKSLNNVNKLKNMAEGGPICTNWYLVTTYYYSDGSTEEMWYYIGTTCVDDCENYLLPCNLNGGGGNGDEGEPQEIIENISETSSEVHDPVLEQAPDGSSLSVETYGPFVTNHQAAITRIANTREVVAVYVYPTTLNNGTVDILDMYGRPTRRVASVFENAYNPHAVGVNGRTVSIQWRWSIICRWFWPTIPYEAPSEYWNNTKNAQRS